MDCIYIAPFIQSALQFMPLIHPFTQTFTYQRRLAAMQGTNQLIMSNWGWYVLLRDTSTHPGWDQTGNPPTARRQLLPPEPYCPNKLRTPGGPSVDSHFQVSPEMFDWVHVRPLVLSALDQVFMKDISLLCSVQLSLNPYQSLSPCRWKWLPQHDGATNILHHLDGIGQVMSDAWFPPEMMLRIEVKLFNFGFNRPENIVSHGLRVL